MTPVLGAAGRKKDHKEVQQEKYGSPAQADLTGRHALLGARNGTGRGDFERIIERDSAKKPDRDQSQETWDRPNVFHQVMADDRDDVSKWRHSIFENALASRSSLRRFSSSMI